MGKISKIKANKTVDTGYRRGINSRGAHHAGERYECTQSIKNISSKFREEN